MNEKDQILFTLKMIEEKQHSIPHAEWKDYEFTLLKKDILDSSGVTISTHTLKRLFGKINYKKDYRPQHATRDAIACYLGYGSWEQFIKENHDLIIEFSRVEKKAKNGRKSNVILNRRSGTILIIVIVMLAMILFLCFMLRRYQVGPGPYEFSADNRNGDVPLTVTFRYDVSEMHSDQLMIDFDYVHPSQGGEFFLSDKGQTFLNHTYQIPGVYRPKLIWQNVPVDSEIIIARSEGWVSFYHPEREIHLYGMDNMYRINMPPGYLTFSRKMIASYGRDTTRVFYTSHRNIMDFEASGDDFRLSAGFINGPDNGGVSCFDSRFIVFCEYSNSMVEFVEHGCHRYSRIKIGEKYYTGEYYDLEALTMTPGEYHVMTMEVKEKTASVYLNGDLVYELIYETSTGEIKGLEVFFKGSGIVDQLTLTNNNNDTVYYENFGATGDEIGK